MSTTTTLQRSVPVIGGRAYQSARQRLHRALDALRIPEVSSAVVVAEFSQLYRSLSPGSAIRIVLAGEPPWLEVRLELDRQQAGEECVGMVPGPGNLLLAAGADEARLHLCRRFPLDEQANLAQADHLLQQSTVEELEEAASQTRQALSRTQDHLSSVQEDLKIAAEIQQRMLASREKLRQIHPGTDCHAYMVPCKDIGGDLFDVISLDADHVAVVVGDVSGKGITAAMMMATCITLLRAYAESFRAPSRIMRKINPRLIEGNEEDCLFTTLFLAIINLQRNSLTYCNAGHNPALLQRADGSLEELNVIHGPAVGVIENVPYEQERVPFHPGDRLLLYTDGVSETFNNQGDLYGSERLLDYCRSTPLTVPARKFLAGLLMDLNVFSGTELSHDDVTLVAICRDQESQRAVVSSEHTQPASVEGMGQLMAASDRFCQQQSIAAEISGRLQLVLDELLVNVVSHGAGASEHEPTIRLLLRFLPEDQLLVVEIRDDGIAFNPFALAEPDTDLTIEERELGGLGIFLVRALARTFSYSYEAPWNTVLLEIDCQSEAQR